MTDDENLVGEIVLVTHNSKQYVNPRQLASHREHRRQLGEWMLELGKDPEKAEGYADATAKTRMHRLDEFYRWVWTHEAEGYTESISRPRTRTRG